MTTETETKYAEARSTQAEAHARLALLQEKTARDGWLADEEELEIVRLERRLTHMAPYVTQLEAALAEEADTQAVEAVYAAWGALLGQKRATYAALFEALEAVVPAFLALAAAHEAQEVLVQSLPRALQTAYSFPTVGTLRQWIAARLPRGVDWLHLLEMSPAIDHHAVLDIDPGTKPLPALVTKYRKEHQHEYNF